MVKTAISSIAPSWIVTGLFGDRASAERACHLLADCGYGKNEVSMLMSCKTLGKCFPPAPKRVTRFYDQAEESMSVGRAIGNTIYEMIANLSTLGAISIPGVALVAVGPIAAAILGVSIGGFVGSWVNLLVGYGIPEESLQSYEKSIQEGGIVICVRPRTDTDGKYFAREWKNIGCEHVYQQN